MPLSCDTHYVVDDDDHKDPYDHGTGASSVKQQCCKISCDIVFEADSSLSCGPVFRCVGGRWHDPYTKGTDSDSVELNAAYCRINAAVHLTHTRIAVLRMVK